MKKPKLVQDWKTSWKWFSVQSNAINVAFLATWSMLPEKFQEALPMPYVIGIAITILVLGTIGRLVKQDAGTDNPK